MTAIKNHIGKEVETLTLGRVRVLSQLPKSKTRLNVLILDRGKGYDQSSGSYKGVKTRGKDKDGNLVSGWSRSENRDFNKEDIIHIKDIC